MTHLAQGSSTDLARLVETEVGLEEMLGRARAEGTALVASAREAAAAREASLAAEVEGEMRRLERRIAEERDRREAELAEQSVREARRFDAVDADDIAALAAYVVERVIGGEL
jgi:hypothetical protein